MTGVGLRSDERLRFVSVAVAARMLGVSPATLYRSIAAEEFPAVRIRGRLIVPVVVIEQIHQAALERNGVVNPITWVRRDAS